MLDRTTYFSKARLNRIQPWLWLALFVCTVIVWLCPVGSRLIRLGLLVATAVVLAWGLCLLRRRKRLALSLAVTANGVHVLAYVGNQTWVEADPGEWKVIQVKVPATNPWFLVPVRIVRWAQLQD
jgi:peptidoglycan/LPS O-acetylase OafA/YrhL